MTKDGGGFQTKVTQAWRAAIQEFEKGRSRRGKATTKLGRITYLGVKNGSIEARVKGFGGGFGGGSYALSLPCVQWLADYESQIAVWLSRRPDWLAELLANEWNESLVSFVQDAGLQLLPGPAYAQALQDESMCTCSEPNMPCQHVLLVIYEMIEQITAQPLHALRYAGVNIEQLLDAVHEASVAHTDRSTSEKHKEKTSLTTTSAEGAITAGAAIWPEEISLMQPVSLKETPSRVIMPELDSESLATWRRNHMAWDASGSPSS